MFPIPFGDEQDENDYDDFDSPVMPIRKTQRRGNRIIDLNSLKGYVYVVKSPTGAYKIGRTKNYHDRMRTFNVKLPFEVEYEVVIQTDDMYELELSLHKHFSSKRVRGEWFNLTDSDIEWIVLNYGNLTTRANSEQE